MDHYHSLSKIRIVDNLIPDFNSELNRKKYGFDTLKTNYNRKYNNNIFIGDDFLQGFEETEKSIENYGNICLSNFGYGKIREIKNKVFLVSDGMLILKM